jgi:hypothetical protein
VASLQHDRLAVPQHVHAGRTAEIEDMIGEGTAGDIDQVGSLRKADRPPGSPVHRDGMIWACAAHRIRRPPCIQMTRAEGRSPSANRHKRDVDFSQLLERQIRAGVARIPAAAGTLDEETERRPAMRTAGQPAAVVMMPAKTPTP